MILVIDDDPSIRAIVRASLERGGFPTVVASSAREALSLVGQHSFELVLTDLHMPEIDGLGFVRQLRTLPGGAVPVVALSGSSVTGSDPTVLAAGFERIWIKPISPARLIAGVKDVLSAPRRASA